MTALASTLSETNETSTGAYHTERGTLLQGTRLWFARGFWVLITGASLGMFAALLPLILNLNDYGDWTIENSAPLFGIDIYSKVFDAYGLVFLGLKYASIAVFVGVAFYIFWRKSDDWLAILVSATLLILPHTFNLGGYTENWFLYHYPWDKLLYALDASFNGIGVVCIYLVFFLFPDGRFVPRWTRWFALLPPSLLSTVWTVGFLNLSFANDNDFLWLALILFFLALLLLVTWSQIYRYRKISTRAQQIQTRIVVASLVTIATVLTLLLFVSIIGAPSFMESSLGALVTFLVNSFVGLLLPLALGVAMLRDQLWQSERVLNRAFVYGALTTILLVVYVFIVGALVELFRTTDNFLIDAAATGVVALLFQPLRERLQRAINRILYGQRDEPFGVLNRLGAQLENTITTETALPLIVDTIGRAMRIPYVGIELTTDGGKTTAAHYGDARSGAMKLPLRYQNETVGELIVARRAPNENFSAADLQLLENVARQAGAVAYAARLNAALRQSRERIINEREQERKRLRRDLHDGLGPTLASQTLKLDAAMDLLDNQNGDSQRARAILQDVKTQTQNTVTDIRRIVYELRPPALDDLGLVGALQAHLAQNNGMNGLEITFAAPNELPALSAAVQVNAYRIVLEAVNNAIKHASASRCEVSVISNGELRLEIGDNGIGGADHFRAGVGLSSMRERAQELGGTFRIEPNEPGGTRVIATLPM